MAASFGQVEPSSEPARKLSDILAAEALLRDKQAHQLRLDLPDQRSRRALEAYATWQQIQQRDYVSRILGVDEYV